MAARADTGLVDAHHHLWDLARFPYPWLRPEAPPRPFGDHAAIKRDFLLDEYRCDMSPGLLASVHVQANCGAVDPVAETAWLSAVAAAAGHRLAIVGQVDAEADDIGRQLDRHAAHAGFRGVRLFAGHDPDPAWCQTDDPRRLSRPQVLRLAEALCKRGFTLDVVVNAAQLRQVADLAARFPDLPVIVNHLGHPRSADFGAAGEWRAGILAAAGAGNVMLKLSALWTIDRGWRAELLAPFLGHAVGAFGAGRCMFGSNLPVEGVMLPPGAPVPRLRAALDMAGIADHDAILRSTALRVYRP